MINKNINIEDLKKFFDYSNVYTDDGKYILEEILKGEELSINRKLKYALLGKRNIDWKEAITVIQHKFVYKHSGNFQLGITNYKSSIIVNDDNLLRSIKNITKFKL